jgi:hypothetical protein
VRGEPAGLLVLADVLRIGGLRDVNPPVFILAAGDCKQGLVYAITPFQTRVLP